MRTRTSRIIGTAAVMVGVVLAAGAFVAYERLPERTVGDIEAVEASLRSFRPPSELPQLPGPVPPAEEDEVPASNPLWEPNRQSLPEDDAGPIPVGLRIETLEVAAPVDPYGIESETGQMAVPDNVEDVAWYRFGASPGQSGSAVLAAHVDLWGQGPGVFFDLKELEPGDLVYVTFDDGTERAFAVEARTTYDKDELPLDVIFSREGPPVLTLITCGGAFSRADYRYDSNIVVYAKPTVNIPGSRLQS